MFHVFASHSSPNPHLDGGNSPSIAPYKKIHHHQYQPPSPVCTRLRYNYVSENTEIEPFQILTKLTQKAYQSNQSLSNDIESERENSCGHFKANISPVDPLLISHESFLSLKVKNCEKYSYSTM